MPFPVQVVQEPRQAPQVFVLAHLAGVVPNRSLHRVHVLSQRFARDPFLEEGDGGGSGGHLGVLAMLSWEKEIRVYIV